MALSASLTGIGGSLFAQYFLYLDPTFMISPELSFQFALLPAVGGLGTAIGPVLGSFLITPLSELLRSYLGSHAAGLHLVIYSAGLIVSADTAHAHVHLDRARFAVPSDGTDGEVRRCQSYDSATDQEAIADVRELCRLALSVIQLASRRP